MSQIEKLLEKLRRSNASSTVADLKRLLEHAGYAKTRQRGSHVHFRKPGSPSITFPVHRGNVKRVYVKEIIKHLDL